jgi:hypothetical protein
MWDMLLLPGVALFCFAAGVGVGVWLAEYIVQNDFWNDNDSPPKGD